MRVHVLSAGALALVIGSAAVAANAQAPAALPTPALHHVHMNSANPEAAIAEYTKIAPTITRLSLDGQPGFKTANNVVFLFNKVARTPPAAIQDRLTARTPQTSFWHFVFSVDNVRSALARFKTEIPNFQSRLLPLYIDSSGKTVETSFDTLPGFLTDAQLAEARARGDKPTGQGAYITWAGPEGAVIENAGMGEPGRMSIFGMFQEQPLCAVLWYQKHLNAPPPAAPQGGQAAAPPRTEANCTVTLGPTPSWPSTYKRGHFRMPPATGVNFSGVSFRWYMNQEKTPLAPMRGGVVDHFALSVADLDPWIAKLRSENVKFLQGPAPYRVGGMRAVMIEGPSKEAIEIIEVK